MSQRSHFFIQSFRTPEIQGSWAQQTPWQPRVDVYQIDAKIVIHVEAPGLREDELHLRMEAGELIVEGQRERPQAHSAQRCLQAEIPYGHFRRTLKLPRGVDYQSIEAHYEDGVLQIIVPLQAAPNHNLKISVD